MNASQHRNTQFEFLDFTQGANSFRVRMIDRNATPQVTAGQLAAPAVILEIPEEDFSAEEMQRVQDVLQMLEEKGAAVYAKHAAKPEDLKSTINAAAQAKVDLEATQIAAAQLEAETIARRADLDAELEAKRKEAEQLAADLATMRAAVEAQAATMTEETTKTE